MIKILVKFYLLVIVPAAVYSAIPEGQFDLNGYCLNVMIDPIKCSADNPIIPEGWIDLDGKCLNDMMSQIQNEIDASYQYLAMGAHFSKDIVNRPGFAEMFLKSAKEERQHASNLIEYLSMRGLLTHNITKLIKKPILKKQEWKNAAEALEDALKLEIEVTTSIRNIITACEKTPNYYHLVDYLTGVFLNEQLYAQRELAGKLITLKKMIKSHGSLGEFLFDKDL